MWVVRFAGSASRPALMDGEAHKSGIKLDITAAGPLTFAC